LNKVRNIKEWSRKEESTKRIGIGRPTKKFMEKVHILMIAIFWVKK